MSLFQYGRNCPFSACKTVDPETQALASFKIDTRYRLCLWSLWESFSLPNSASVSILPLNNEQANRIPGLWIDNSGRAVSSKNGIPVINVIYRSSVRGTRGPTDTTKVLSYWCWIYCHYMWAFSRTSCRQRWARTRRKIPFCFTAAALLLLIPLHDPL